MPTESDVPLRDAVTPSSVAFTLYGQAIQPKSTDSTASHGFSVRRQPDKRRRGTALELEEASRLKSALC